jgi:hypothetical protein
LPQAGFLFVGAEETRRRAWFKRRLARETHSTLNRDSTSHLLKVSRCPIELNRSMIMIYLSRRTNAEVK